MIKYLIGLVLISFNAMASFDDQQCKEINKFTDYYSQGVSCAHVYDLLTKTNSLESRTINWTNDAVSYCENGTLTREEIEHYRTLLANKIADYKSPKDILELKTSYKTLLAGATTIGVKAYTGEMRDPFSSHLHCGNEHSLVRILGNFKNAVECSACYKNKDCDVLKPYRGFLDEINAINENSKPEIKKIIEAQFPKFCSKLYNSEGYITSNGPSVAVLYQQCLNKKPDQKTNLDHAYEVAMVASKKEKMKRFDEIFSNEKYCKEKVEDSKPKDQTPDNKSTSQENNSSGAQN